MIFESQMPPAVFITWLQLRCLTWGGRKIPPFSVQEWVDLTGSSRTTLIRHLNWLQRLRALRWHSPEPGMVSVSFEGAARMAHISHERCLKTSSIPKMDSSKLDSSKLDSPKLDSSPSLNPHSSSSQILILEPGNQGSDQIIRDEVEAGGERESEGECEGESLQLLRAFTGGLPNLNTPEQVNLKTRERLNGQNVPLSKVPATDPISAYRSLAHLTPNASQQRILSSAVTDLPLWQGTLDHWLMHGWNPRNITGMLELYARGGAAGCRFCLKKHLPKQEPKTAQEQTHEALEDLRRELGLPSQPKES
jgi:hypothetical protein